jgi:hypothetical protein
LTSHSRLFDSGVDIAQLVDEMRTAIASQEEADIDLLRDIAAQYSELCDVANRRLVECHSLLRRGLRSEAIQACERDPKVLELVEMLDFPERDQWCVLSQLQWDMAQPPLLKIDLAADLNEAYAEEESLSSLLKKHRLLALGHGSLAARISILRSIHQRDPANPVWEQDLASYERARLKQIINDLAKADESEDAQQAVALYEEVSSDQWTIRPDHDLVQRCANLNKRLQATFARQQLVVAESRLNQAYGAFDVAAARAAKQLWDGYLPTADLAADDSLLEKAQPALDWLAERELLEAEEADFQTGCAQFAADLDARASIEELERQYHSLVRTEREIPPVLEIRYTQRVEAHQLTSKRRFRIAMAIAVGTLGIAATVVVMFILKGHRDERIQTAVASLDNLIANENYEGALQAFDRIRDQDPTIAASPALLTLRGQVDQARDAESQRRKAFQNAMSSAKQSGIVNPDSTALTRAHELARTSAEEAEVQELQAEVERSRTEKQRERDEQFAVDFEELRTLLAQVDSSEGPDDASRRQLLAKTRSSLDMLLAKHRLASASLRQQTELVGRRLNAIEQELDLRRRQRESLTSLIANIGDVAAYKEAAGAYVQRHPETAMATDLKQAVRESPSWEGLAEWCTFLASPGMRDLRNVSPSAAEQLLKEGDSLVEKQGGIPLADEFKRRVEFLKAIAARVGKTGTPIQESIVRLQSDSLISNMWMIKTSDDKRYYLQEKPELGKLDLAEHARVSHISGPDYSVKISSIKVPAIVYNDLSPQTKLMKDIVGKLDTLAPGDWDSTFWQILQQIHSDEHLDPILKYILLNKTLTVACDGSLLMKSALSSYLNELKTASVDLSVNWLDPGDKEADNIRRQLASLLSKMPASTDVKAAVDQLIQSVAVSPPSPMRWIGILVRNDNGSWSCAQKEGSRATGPLFVVLQEQSGGVVSLKEIGTLNEGIATWQSPVDTRFLQGRPIFVREESK